MRKGNYSDPNSWADSSVSGAEQLRRVDEREFHTHRGAVLFKFWRPSDLLRAARARILKAALDVLRRVSSLIYLPTEARCRGFRPGSSTMRAWNGY